MQAKATLRSAYSLKEYVQDVTEIVNEGLALQAKLRSIAQCKRRLLMTDGVLSDEQIQRLDKPYTRNLLYTDPGERFVVVAILWGPNSESPVHDHNTWGVMGVYDNFIRIINYERLDDGSRECARLEEREGLIAPRGSVGYVIPPYQEIHRMENPTDKATIGIHTYGKAVEKCRVFDLETGCVEQLSLCFDHDATGCLS